MNYRDKIFSTSELKGEQIDNSKFTGCQFYGTLLKFSSFKKCVFENCDFTGVIFEGTSFEGCDFAGCKLSNLDFSSVVFIKSSFNDAIIENSVFRKIKASSNNETVRYDLRECTFVGTSLLNSIFIKCDFEKVDFGKAKLANAVFSKCKLTKTVFVGADISGVNFEDSIVDQTELDYSGFVQYGNSRGFKLC